MSKKKNDNSKEINTETTPLQPDEAAENAASQEAPAPEETDANAKLAEMNDCLLRLAAEYDNYRKRTDREKQASISFGISTTVETFLPAFDILEKAAAAECTDADYKKGVEMTVELFKAAFSALGVTEIEAEGKPFDPELHSAVSREVKDGAESETVVTVLQKGYKIGDRVIRHAVVTVAE